MTDSKGCPEGMYPTGTEQVTFPGTAQSLADLRGQVEPMLGALNLPLGWWFNDETIPDFDPSVDQRHFELVLWMPRKMKTWSVRVCDYDHEAVQEWLDTTIKSAVMEWFGWEESDE